MATPVLIICHPGHELRVFGWMCDARPEVCVLTDGSGGGRVPRTESSRRVVTAADGTVGPLFGAIPDSELYRRLLDRDWTFFTRLVDRLAVILHNADARLVVGDSAEGYNSGHDICRLLIDTAVTLAGRPIENLAFPVVDEVLSGTPVAHLQLPVGVLARKWEAAHGYDELRDEVDAAVARFGNAAFAEERLYSVTPFVLPDGTPRYETFGRERVTTGRYHEVIRREHLDRLLLALRTHAVEGQTCAR